MSLANTEAVLQEALAALESERAALELAQKALEVERRARSKTDQEVLVLRGRVMGTEDASAWLREQMARQAEDFSTLEASCISTYLFLFSRGVDFFLSLFLSLSPFFQSWMKR